MLLFDPFAPSDLLTFGRRTAFLPAIDLAVGENDMVLAMDLPGFTTGDLDIQVLDDELVISGERKRPELPEGASWAHAERGFGAFERRVRLPQGVDPEAITASMTDGVLSLIVPKPERMKPHRLQITSSSPSEQRELTTA